MRVLPKWLNSLLAQKVRKCLWLVDFVIYLHIFLLNHLYRLFFFSIFASFNFVKHVVCEEERLSDSFVGQIGVKSLIDLPIVTGYNIFLS